VWPYLGAITRLLHCHLHGGRPLSMRGEHSSGAFFAPLSFSSLRGSGSVSIFSSTVEEVEATVISFSGAGGLWSFHCGR